MKKTLILLSLLILLSTLGGCGNASPPVQIAATTLPVYEFTARLCQGTGLQVTRLVTESVSCLHDYTLQVSQMRAIESAEVVVISGAGLEEFLEDALDGADTVIDASADIPLLCGDHEEHEGHHHENDPHIWLSPANAKIMVQNIRDGLSRQFPENADAFRENAEPLLAELDALQTYGTTQLSDLRCRELVTFHDGFGYLAQAFDLTILEAVEEESGSEAAASELIELIELTRAHDLPAIFTEVNGSTAAASVIAAETGVKTYPLDMAMASGSYFDAMYRNIDTLKEALG